MVLSYIESILGSLDSIEGDDVCHLRNNSLSFLKKVENVPSLGHWAKMIRFQFESLKPLYARYEPRYPSTPIGQGKGQASTNPTQAASTPQANRGGSNVEQFHTFSPLVPPQAKLPCTVSGCSSRFAYSRSYVVHMKSHHPGKPINYNVRDPVGTCRLISRWTSRECGSKLGLKTMYVHLKTLHGVDKPKDMTLVGFNLQPTPTAVFVPKREVTTYVSQNQPQNNPPERISTQPGATAQRITEGLLSEGEPSKNETVDDPLVENVGSSIIISDDDAPKCPIQINVKDVSSPVLQKRHIDADTNHALAGAEAIQISDDEDIASPKFMDVEEDKTENEKIPSETPVSRRKKTRTKRKLINSPSPLKKSFTNKSIADLADEEFPDMVDTNDNSVPSSPIGEKSKNQIETSGSPIGEKEKNRNESVDHTILEASNLSLIDDNVATHNQRNTDSDYEDGDTDSYTQNRLSNKKIRHGKRNDPHVNLYELPENSKFIEDMVNYMKLDAISTKNKHNSTISKNLRNLFHNADSFLSHEYFRDNSFNLEQLRNFKSEDFKNLKYPIEWLTSTCSRDDEGSKGVERLKSHQDLRSFLEFEVDKFDSGIEFAPKKQAIRDNLASIAKQVSTGRLYRKYKIIANNLTQEEKRAKQILSPSKGVNTENCVRVWNKSLEREQADRDFKFSYEEAFKKQYISKKGLTSWAHNARMNLCLSDRSRGSVYKFTMKDYIERIPQWYPEDYDGFNELPDDWNPNIPPSDDVEPSVWMIKISGMFTEPNY